MSILPQILDWSRQRPAWQQDALRRLVEQSDLSGSDFAELTALCRAEHGLSAPDTLTAKPLTVGATAPASSAGETTAVRLTGVHSLQGVNALLEDQTLGIAPSGITVVYGDNGAGKSGYVRVLKQVCRSRGARDAVHPNVYAANGKPASAVVTFVVVPDGGSNEADADTEPTAVTRDVTWNRGVAGNADLSQVSVFDSRSAAVYVTKENEVAYLPGGTDLFPKLVRVCEVVKGLIDGEISAIDRDRDRFAEILTDTPAYALLRELHLPKARELFDQYATMSDEDHAQLATLRAEDKAYQAENPLGRARSHRQCVARLTAARSRLTVLEAALDHSAMRGLSEAHAALAAAAAAADLASGAAFGGAPLGGVGTEAWRSLWEAARRYAEQAAEPAQVFPPHAAHEDGAVCVLCQQEVGASARRRMQAFEAFVRGETRTAVNRARSALDARILALEVLTPTTLADAALLDEIKSLDEELASILTDCLSELTRHREEVLISARAHEATPDWSRHVYEPRGACERLLALETRVTAEAALLEEGADPEVRKATEAALRALESRALLDGMRERVYAEIGRQSRRVQLERAGRSTSTTGITRYGTDVLREAVSEPLAKEFTRQLAALGLTHLPITVNPSHGQKGRTLHTLSIGATVGSKVPTDEVLSEGEYRCTALAAFFAEIAFQESTSTVVFDDPVSSLDHARRQYVADRLADIAHARPVLVFTHDLSFLWMLHNAAEAAEIALVPRYFRRASQGAGLVTDELPWAGLPVAGRARFLKNELQALKKLATADRAAYVREVRTFYRMLRDTWERCVEEVLMNNAVRRFDRVVKTQSLKNLHRVTESQMTTFVAGMTKSSVWQHDQPSELALSVPEFDEVCADFAALDQWLSELKVQNSLKS